VLLEGPLYRVANLAMEAHRLLCLYAPQFLRSAARASWQQDAGVFSAWLSAFDEACRAGELISPARLPLEVVEALEADSGRRAPLLLAGFDRILPVQRRLFEAWGECREAPRGERAERIFFHRAADENAELAACALWCKGRLSAASHARLLIITQDAAKRRGEIERAFLNLAGNHDTANGGSRLFEFSLGVPLKSVTLARGALLALRWLSEPIAEPELDWLLSTGQIAADEEETRSLTAFMRALRRRGWERTHWRLEDFLRQRPGNFLPENWIARMSQARRRLEEFTRRPSAASERGSAATPIAWTELVPQLLQLAGWPGGRGLTSAEFQAVRRWQQMLDECGSLAFDGRRVEWNHFLKALERTLHETLFAPESQDAPILIAGPAESAGLAADAVWFLGASVEGWPSRSAAHPLLPLDAQRNAGMPHSSAQLDWDLAGAVTERLLTSAPEVHFSYARQSEGVEMRPSRLVVNTAGAPQSLPAELAALRAPDALTICFEDRSRIPFFGGEVRGGANVLTAQSQCAFKAFATARLGAQGWEPAEAGLTAAQRGQLLHAVLHSIWSGPPEGIRSHAELMKLADLGGFVKKHVHRLLREKIPASAREQMPRRYLELEEIRLTGLITEWLRFEATRASFLVEGIEVERDETIAGLALKLRLDRLDRLADGTFLVIDYKTGDVSQKSWEMPRPDDVQLPLYAGFALDRDAEPLGGLVFAKIRAAERSFAGRAFDAAGQLLPGMSARNDLVKKPLDLEDLEAWREYIETLAREFLEGRADVNPREYPKTCERCGLQTLCRVVENQTQSEMDTEDDLEAENA
jgi:probable DNA repair protein